MKDDNKSTAYRFIILMGIVSLFGDITYEGARSITGPYLFMLGASASRSGLRFRPRRASGIRAQVFQRVFRGQNEVLLDICCSGVWTYTCYPHALHS